MTAVTVVGVLLLVVAVVVVVTVLFWVVMAVLIRRGRRTRARRLAAHPDTSPERPEAGDLHGRQS